MKSHNSSNDRKKDIFVSRIFAWYDDNKRDYLFWRKTRNPYHILISEIMLQKTTAKQVQSIVKKFIKQFPNVEMLACSSADEIKKVITPLGMEHRRSENLKNLAVTICDRYKGLVPSSQEELISLSGVGRYIANSVMYLAYNKNMPIVDTNIIRILERIFNIRSEKSRPRCDETLWNYVRDITPDGKFRQTNLALLDFGALICTSKKPKCSFCCVRSICYAFWNNLV